MCAQRYARYGCPSGAGDQPNWSTSGRAGPSRLDIFCFEFMLYVAEILILYLTFDVIKTTTAEIC